MTFTGVPSRPSSPGNPETEKYTETSVTQTQDRKSLLNKDKQDFIIV